jgi:hypothetical protein
MTKKILALGVWLAFSTSVLFAQSINFGGDTMAAWNIAAGSNIDGEGARDRDGPPAAGGEDNDPWTFIGWDGNPGVRFRLNMLVNNADHTLGGDAELKASGQGYDFDHTLIYYKENRK